MSTSAHHALDASPVDGEAWPLSHGLHPDSSLARALESMLSSEHGVLAVFDPASRAQVGLVTMDSLLALWEERDAAGQESVTTLATRALTIANADTTVAEAIGLMKRSKVRHLPVLGQDTKLQTLVSRRDLNAFLSLCTEDELDGARATRLGDFVGEELWTTTRTTTLAEVAQTLRDNRFGCLPVVEEGHLLGIITETDLLRALLQASTRPAAAGRLELASFVSAATPILSPSDSLGHALERMAYSKHSTLMIAESGQPVGVLSESDLMRALNLREAGSQAKDRGEILSKPIRKIMTHGLVSADVSTEVSDAAELLIERKVHSLIVLDGKRFAGIFGPREVFRVAGKMRVPWLLRDVMTNVIFEIDSHETLSSGLGFLESAGVRGLVVREGAHPIGIFGQEEALAAATHPLETPVENVMSARILCLPDDMPCFRAAQQAAALGVHQIVVSSKGSTCGLVSASDFVHLLTRPPGDEGVADTLEEIHI